MYRRDNGLRIQLCRVALLLAGVVATGTVLFAQKPSLPKQEMVSIKGRTLAGVEYLTGYLRGGLGDRYEVFVFGVEPSKQGRPITPVKVMYRFFQSEAALPDSFLAVSKRYELQVIREPNCDDTVENLSYQKNSGENGKPLASTYILRPLDGAPKDVLKADLVLACYVMRPGKYKVLE